MISRAFEGLKNIEQIILPKDNTIIEDRLFFNCKSLVELENVYNVVEINEEAIGIKEDKVIY